MSVASFLTDVEIEALNAAGTPLARPFNPRWVQGASIDLHLSGEQYSYNKEQYRIGDALTDEDYTHSSFTEITLKPTETAFVGVLETLAIPANCIGFVFARSSLTRLGLNVAPVFMNPGYTGRMPLTLTNAAAFPMTIRSGIRVAQLVCARLAVNPTKLYDGVEAKYANEHMAPSRIYQDKDINLGIIPLTHVCPEPLTLTIAEHRVAVAG